MKKIGKKLSYITKVFLAVGLLFNNLSSLSIVFADEVNPDDGSAVVETTPDSNSGTQTVAPDTGSGDGSDGKTPNAPDAGDSGNVAGSPSNPTSDPTDPNADPNQAPTSDPNQTPTSDPNQAPTSDPNQAPTSDPTADPVDPNGETKPVEDPVELKFEVSINENAIIVKHNKALDLSEASELKVVEDFKYLDGTTYGGEEHKITLTDAVKAALASDEGYSLESVILPENVYAGEYSVNAYIDEDQALTSKVIEAEGEGIEFKLYTASEEEVKAEDDGVYYFESDEQSFLVTARLLNGGVSPSDKVTIGEEEIVASELFQEGQILEEALEGYLHGEFAYNVSLDYSLSGNAKTASKTFDIFYLAYSDNTDGLNESAKNVGLDNKYVFVGGYADNIVYSLDSEGIEEILKDFVGEDGIITYEINTDDGLVVTLTDGRVTITYEEATLDSSRTMDARLEADSIEVSAGDTLTVKYLVTLTDDPINGFSGMVKYDEELLKLTNVESSVIESGGVSDNAFLYAQWVMLQADYEEDDDGNITYKPTDLTLVTFTFEALKSGEATISIEDAKFYQRDVYLEPEEELNANVTITESNTLASLSIAGQEIPLEDGLFNYSIEVENDVTVPDVVAIASDSSSSIGMFYPEELVEGENTIRIVVKTASGESQEYVITVIRKAKEEANNNESTVTPIAYNDNTYVDDGDNNNDSKVTPVDDDGKDKADDNDTTKENNLSRIIIIILILLVIAGLIYLIFKDDGDEEEKQANKDINKFKNDDDFDKHEPRKTEHKPNNNKSNHNRNNQSNKNTKKGR